MDWLKSFFTKMAIWLKTLFAKDFSPLLIILIAGSVGGVLAESAMKIVGGTPVPLDMFGKIGLGIAAAGIGTLVLANSNRDDRIQLFFFALLCALTYPKIIGTIFTDKEKQVAAATVTNDVGKQAKIIATVAADEIGPEARQQVEDNIENAITATTEAAEKSGNTASATEDLTALAKAAREQGYDGVAVSAAEGLKSLGATDKLNEVFESNEAPR